MKGYWVSKGKTPCIINLGTRRTCDSSVCIALGYRLDNRCSMVRLPTGAGNFSLHHRVQNGSGPQVISLCGNKTYKHGHGNVCDMCKKTVHNEPKIVTQDVSIFWTSLTLYWWKWKWVLQYFQNASPVILYTTLEFLLFYTNPYHL
jgi:hypothetical protein